MRPLTETLPILTRDIIDTVANRPHLDPEEQALRAEAARLKIEAFAPRDVMEIMFVGQIVVMQSMMLDAAAAATRAQTPEAARRHRTQVIAMARAQMNVMKDIRLHRAAIAKAASVVLAPEPAPVEVVEPPPVEAAPKLPAAIQDTIARPQPPRAPSANPAPPQPTHLPGLPAPHEILSVAAQLERAVRGR